MAGSGNILRARTAILPLFLLHRVLTEGTEEPVVEMETDTTQAAEAVQLQLEEALLLQNRAMDEVERLIQSVAQVSRMLVEAAEQRTHIEVPLRGLEEVEAAVMAGSIPSAVVDRRIQAVALAADQMESLAAILMAALEDLAR